VQLLVQSHYTAHPIVFFHGVETMVVVRAFQTQAWLMRRVVQREAVVEKVAMTMSEVK
jgi:hypothetical protein